MTSFQLDKNIDDRKVIERCQAEGHGDALRLPRDLRDAEDPELLQHVMARPTPLVTLDRRLPRDHTVHIPDHNPGVIVVTNYPKKFPTMTSSIALQILARVKNDFPQWHQSPLNNSILRDQQ